MLILNTIANLRNILPLKINLSAILFLVKIIYNIKCIKNRAKIVIYADFSPFGKGVTYKSANSPCKNL